MIVLLKNSFVLIFFSGSGLSEQTFLISLFWRNLDFLQIKFYNIAFSRREIFFKKLFWPTGNGKRQRETPLDERRENGVGKFVWLEQLIWDCGPRLLLRLYYGPWVRILGPILKNFFRRYLQLNGCKKMEFSHFIWIFTVTVCL